MFERSLQHRIIAKKRTLKLLNNNLCYDIFEEYIPRTTHPCCVIVPDHTLLHLHPIPNVSILHITQVFKYCVLHIK